MAHKELDLRERRRIEQAHETGMPCPAGDCEAICREGQDVKAVRELPVAERQKPKTS